MNHNKDLRALLPLLFSNNSRQKNQIFLKLRERFYNLVRLSIWDSRKNRHEMLKDVEDIVQEILISVERGIRNQKVDADKIVPWTIKIARNKINDYLRRKYGKGFDHLELEVEPADSEMNRPDRNFEKKDMLQGIKEAIGMLNKKDQEIINALINGEIKSYIQNEAKKIPVETVYVHIHRCRKRFEKILRKEGII